MHNRKIAVIGLGYVGLPLAIHLGLKNRIVGLDTNSTRIEELTDKLDRTNEIAEALLLKSDCIFTTDAEAIKHCDFYIITVPTPVNDAKHPNLKPIQLASKTVASYLKSGDIVVYESTVYPGTCEEFCAPLLETFSGLKFKEDFDIGYSPERINPGDKKRTLTNIMKIISASNQESLDIIDEVYSSIITAGIHRAPSIKVAEAAKVIENTQRDINIALMNELAIIFDRLQIDTHDVLEAAGTKWNFLNFKPGLVGGHCIGVDPYYLTYKAEVMGLKSKIILAGRDINDHMGEFIVEKTIKELIKSGKMVKGLKLAVLGLSFKENCPDLRNSKSFDIIEKLLEYDIDVSISDPYISAHDLPNDLKHRFFSLDELSEQSAIVLAVSHNEYKSMNTSEFYDKTSKDMPVFIDVKDQFSKQEFPHQQWHYWRL